MERTTACTQCGSKIAITRDRCPKCRAFVVRQDTAAQAASSRRLARSAAAVLGAFALILFGLWMRQAPVPETATVARAGDPLAARRDAAPGAAPAEAAAPSQAESRRPFLDNAGKGTVAYAAGDYAGALAGFEEAVKQNPQDAEALSNLGQVLVRLERSAEAIPHLERAAALNPDRWTYRFNLARALGLLGRWDESIASYRQAQTLFPDDYVTTFNLALALHKKGNDAAAVDEYKKAIASNPGEASFRMALAISYEALQQKPEAAGQYAEYLRLSPLASDTEKVRTKIAQLTSTPAAPVAPVAPSADSSTR